MSSGGVVEKLAHEALWQELLALEERLSTLAGEDRIKELFRKLRMRHVELETQNRELREACDAMEEAGDRCTALYDLAPMGYMILDNRGVVREINLAGAQMLGRSRSELVGRPLVPRLAPGHNSAFYKHLNGVFGDPVKTTTELALRVRQKDTTWIRFESVRVRNEGETVCRTVMIDVSERHRLEEDLCHRQRQLQRVIDAVPALVVHIGHDMCFRGLNVACRSWFNMDAMELLGSRADALLDADMVEALQSCSRRVLNGEVVTFQSNVEHHLLGRRPVSVTLIPDAEGDRPITGYFAVTVDISRQDTLRKQ